MRLELELRQFGWMLKLVRLLFGCVLLLASFTPSWASAQSKDDPWAKPLNLSHSGVAINPSLVIDSEGVVHAVWQDDLSNFVYSQLNGDQWSTPQTTNLDVLFRLPIPGQSQAAETSIYTGPNPFFIAGPGKSIYAFWISRQGRLFTSYAQDYEFAHVAAWDPVRLITPGAASFAVALDARGELHLAYVRTVDDPVYPAGIYYTRLKFSSANWSVPVLLYESSYLRSLNEGEANISIATAGAEDAMRVYVAWDNRPRKQVFLAQSADSGKSWEKPTLVEGPAPDSGLTGPFNIHAGANQSSVILVWQSGVLGGACSQIFQYSGDAGATWSNPQPMTEDLSGCAQSIEFVTGLATSPEGPLYFLTETQTQVFLTAWNGRQWSPMQEQPTLSEFEEPEIYTEVIYGCHRSAMLGERMYILGCDQGGGGDIWLTSRDLGSNTSWFSPPVWSQLSPVTSDNFRMEAAEMVATDDGLVHAFFSQHQDPSIYYAFWNGDSWSRITPVMRLPDGEATAPTVAAGPENELFLIAPSNKGALYFSRATSGNAASESRWSKPARLETGHDGAIGSVDVAWDTAGTIYVAYSVPVNQERGIYLVQSKDHGASWSEPLQVFNGAAAGFDLVGAPSLLTSTSGSLHVIWREQSIQGDGVPESLSLYYSRSEDGGHSFIDAKQIVEEPVAWREIVTDDNGNLHLLWQPQNTLNTVWDQISLDDGNSWQFPQGLPDEGSLRAVARDPAGRLQLVGVTAGALGHWLWDGSRWQLETPLHWSLARQQEKSVDLLAAAVNKQGKMVVVLAAPTGPGNEAARTLLYSTRTLELPTRLTATPVVPTQTLLSPTLAPATPTPERSSTPTSAVETEPANPQAETDLNKTNGPISPLTMALLPVALLLLSVLGIAIRATQLKDR